MVNKKTPTATTPAEPPSLGDLASSLEQKHGAVETLLDSIQAALVEEGDQGKALVLLECTARYVTDIEEIMNGLYVAAHRAKEVAHG